MKQESARRQFLIVVASALGGLAGARQNARAFPGTQTSPGSLTIREVIESIREAIPEEGPENTVDTVKIGDPGQLVTGIATTFLATCDVIRKSVDQGANLIITHEPTFYNHRDETDWLRGNSVYEYKRRLILDSGVVVWRFHDYWHLVRPDPVSLGLLKDLDLDRFADPEIDGLCRIPATPLQALASSLKHKLGVPFAKVVGRPDMECSKLGILPGAWGGRSQIEFLQKHGIDVLVCGEINEWETSVFVQDALAAGESKALIILGHINTEEAGMRMLVDWIGQRFPGIPVSHVPGDEPFLYL